MFDNLIFIGFDCQIVVLKNKQLYVIECKRDAREIKALSGLKNVDCP